MEVAAEVAEVAEVAVDESRPHPTSSLPALGVGLGFRPSFRSDLFRHQEQVDFLEIIIEHYLEASPEKMRELDLLSSHFTIVPHGLNLSLGSAEGLDLSYVEKVAHFIQQLDPPWWSEHIAWTRSDEVEIGHLSPVPFTQEALDTLCQNIEAVQQIIHCPLLLENITYPFLLPGAEMSEPEFLTALCSRVDCGLLLDATNVFTNATNHQYDPVVFLEEIPLERIVQLHFTGGHWQGETLIDSHSQPTPPEVWSLLKNILEQAPVKGMILERDENIPPFRELLQELATARQAGQQHNRW